MKKFSLILAISLTLISCPSVPKMDDPNLQTDLTKQDREQENLFNTPDQKETEFPLEEGSQGQPGIHAPVLELAEADYPTETPDESLPRVTDEPIAQQPPLPVVTPPVVPPPVIAPTPPPQPVEPPPEPPIAQKESENEEKAPLQQTPSYAIPDMPFQPVTIIPDPTEANLPYSRTVRAQVGQYIEIPFRGSGWIYLGEFGSRRGVSYDSRRMDQEGMTFIFRADAEGTYSLRFNRHDFVRDTILNDYVKVIVEQPPPTTGSSWSNPQVGSDRVYALPRWPLATDPDGSSSQIQSPNNGTAAVTVPGITQNGSTTGDISGNAAPITYSESAGMAATDVLQTTDWLKVAREEYNAGRIKNALDALDKFMAIYPAGSDEAFWLYGQSLEANNEATRDIRLSLDYYRRLTREFPLSSRYDEARQRIAYMERFYFNIQ